jgi:hypothetical protein
MTAWVDHSDRNRKITYWVLGLIFVVMAGTALLIFDSSRDQQQAEQKADQLITELNSAGLRSPSKDQIVAVLGDDGGATCADPVSALGKGTVYGMMTNGAGGPGTRPVIADTNVLKGQLLVIKVYCPKYIEEFQEFADDLKTADVAKG